MADKYINVVEEARRALDLWKKWLYPKKSTTPLENPSSDFVDGMGRLNEAVRQYDEQHDRAQRWEVVCKKFAKLIDLEEPPEAGWVYQEYVIEARKGLLHGDLEAVEHALQGVKV